MKEMKKQLIDLLNIQAPSGQEQKVVKYARPILESTCDKVWLDSYENLLAEKIVGSGKGATIILSAHMDSVSGLDKNRKVVERNGVFHSTKGILGADDRAGIAIILSVIRNIEKTGFEGKIKVAFSREEEIGCVGSSKIDKEWIKGSDLAIVVDRRGNKDIVVGNYSQAFCSTEVGKFLEECSAMQDMDWKACEGGISDACTFADQGVHSVNLSAGYENEHTSKEFVVFKDMQKTVNLILQAMALVNDFAGNFGEVTATNQWIQGYDDYAWGEGWFDIPEDEELFRGKETYGKVTADLIDGNICITQKTGKNLDEIYITRQTFESIIQSYNDHMGSGTIVEDDLPFAELDEIEREFVAKHGKHIRV